MMGFADDLKEKLGDSRERLKAAEPKRVSCTCNALPIPHYHTANGIEPATPGSAPIVDGSTSGSTL